MATILACALIAAGITGFILAFWPKMTAETTNGNLPQYSAPAEDVPGNWLPILDTQRLLERAEAVNLAALIHRDSLAEPRNYDQYYLPVIEHFLEFSQLMPASESHHHAQPGGMIVHTLETCAFALKRRQGMMLPRGARPEEQARLKHRWTYALMVATLLHDIGKPMRDLKITFYKNVNDPGVLWNPLAGSLKEVGARYYHVAFTDQENRDYSAHTKLPVALLQRCVPQQAVQWLAEDPALMSELTAYLSGDNQDGVLAQIITEADGESVRRNLLSGPRTRFATARVVPLIERLMEAMRRMLAEGGTLPLNRNGAVGWVHRGEIWFVAKRLADEVRGYLRQNESASGLPGDDKNDRLFDTWQEHGALIPNPASNQAVWRVKIEGFDGGGYTHEFAVLRFPLALLYADPQLYPKSFVGEINVIGQNPAPPSADDPAVATIHAPTLTPPDSTPTVPAIVAHAQSDSLAQAADGLPPMRIQADVPRLQQMGVSMAALEDFDGDDGGFLDDGETAAAVVVSKAPIPTASTATSAAKVSGGAIIGSQSQAAPSMTAVDSKGGFVPISGQVQPAIPPLPSLAPQKTSEVVAEEAARFLAWIKEGLANAKLTYNCPNARIHFLAEGLLVVSPLTFREFATESLNQAGGLTDEASVHELESKVQKAIVKAGWTLKGPKRVNIIKYRVVKKGDAGKGGAILNGMVFARPFIEQHVKFPAINLFLERFQPESA